MIYQIEISFKKQFRDKHGEHVKHEVLELGAKGIAAVKYFPVYRIEGNLSRQEVERISSRLLIDPVTEQYSIKAEDPRRREGKTGKDSKNFVAEIWLKKGVTDTAAESVEKAVKDIGVAEKLTIKTGHKFIFEGKTNPTIISGIAKKILYNPMIQECNIQGL